jgi:hypothetical protein
MNDWLYLIHNVDTKPFLKGMEEHQKSWHLEKDLLLTKSTRGEQSTQIEYTDAINLSKIFKKQMSEVLDKDYVDKLEPACCWSVQGFEGSYHTMHRHISLNDDHCLPKLPAISTVLYLDVPEKKTKEAGDFYFMLLKEKELKYSSISPKVGDFIVMPSNVFHGTYPQNEGLRRTLNMDFVI